MKPEFLKIPLSEYLNDPAPAPEPSLTRSLIVTLLGGSPAEAAYQHPKINLAHDGFESNKAMDTGTAAHALLLEGREVFEVIDAADFRTKAAQEARDAARAAGKVPMLPEAYREVQAMVLVAQDKLRRAGINLDAGMAERSIVWQSGCWLRTRPDWVSDDGRTVIEYKTTASTPADWTRNLYAKGYDIQAAMHRSGVAAATGKEPPRVIFAVQSTEAPYSMFFRELSGLYYEIAHRKIARAVDIWQKCIEARQWPDYGIEAEVVDPANWQITAEEERELAHEGWSVEAFLFGKVKGDEK
jgi:hypothetical protein